MEPEIKQLIDEIGETTRSFTARAEKLEKRINNAESRLDVLATFGGSTEKGGNPANDGKFWIPTRGEMKGQSINDDPGGGYLVPEANADLYFDRLRPASVVLSANPVIYRMKTDAEWIPRLGSSVTVVNPGEGGTITDSTLGFAAVRLASRKYSTRTICSSEWLDDSTPSGRTLVQRDHELSIAAALDRDFLQGDGVGNRVLGMRNWPDVNELVLASGSGAVCTLDDVLGGLSRMEANGAKPSAIFMAPRTWAQLRAERSIANGVYHLAPDVSAEAERRIFGVPVFVSGQIALTEAPGGSDSSYVLIADMTRVVVGIRREVRLLVDPFSRSANDQVVIQHTARFALAVMGPESIEIIGGCQPSA